jgi:cell division protein FtsL
MQEKADRHEVGLLLFLLGVVCLVVIWVRTATVKKTYEYVQHEKELRQLEQEIQALRLEWLKWTAPERLEDLAEKRDLQRPDPEQVYRYSVPRQ